MTLERIDEMLNEIHRRHKDGYAGYEHGHNSDIAEQDRAKLRALARDAQNLAKVNYCNANFGIDGSIIKPLTAYLKHGEE